MFLGTDKPVSDLEKNAFAIAKNGLKMKGKKKKERKKKEKRFWAGGLENWFGGKKKLVLEKLTDFVHLN